MEQIIYSASLKKHRRSSAILWRHPRSSRGSFRARFKGDSMRKKTYQPPNFQPSTDRSCGIGFPRRVGPGTPKSGRCDGKFQHGLSGNPREWGRNWCKSSSWEGEPERQEMKSVQQLAAENDCTDRARVPATRPATGYTARVIPQHDGVKFALKATQTLWQR